MLRLLFIIIYAIFIIIASPFLWLYMNIIGKKDPDRKDQFAAVFVRKVFRAVVFLSGIKLTVIGSENIPKDEPVIYIGNHRGFFDIVTSFLNTRGVGGFIAKKELKKVPIISTWMVYLNCLFLDRSDPKEGLKTILNGIDNLKNGKSVIIFPEGTRNTKDTLMEFKDGSFKLATKSKRKIIPFAIVNTEAVFENQLPFIKASKVIIEFAKPIDVNDMTAEDKKNIAPITQAVVQQMYTKNKKLL